MIVFVVVFTSNPTLWIHCKVISLKAYIYDFQHSTMTWYMLCMLLSGTIKVLKTKNSNFTSKFSCMQQNNMYSSHISSKTNKKFISESNFHSCKIYSQSVICHKQIHKVYVQHLNLKNACMSGSSTSFPLTPAYTLCSNLFLNFSSRIFT